tara:strand:+ start:469 stop:723 length:255 start_codon:yes stop_codon:yes gene_type:complete
MKPYTKGLLLGIFVTVSCIGFLAKKEKPEIGRYIPYGTGKMQVLDTVTGDIIWTLPKDSPVVRGEWNMIRVREEISTKYISGIN